MEKKEIKGFFNEFRFLSNFYPSEIEIEGIVYPTVEHAYQSFKTTNVEERKRLSKISTPRKVKHEGYKLSIRPDWEEIKIDVMEMMLRKKFEIPKFREALSWTEGYYLEETNHWGDTFWGVCEKRGFNNLGKLLMKIREENKSL